MVKSALVRIIKALTEKELRQVKQVIEKEKKEVKALFQFLIENLNAGNIVLAKEQAFATIFPGMAYDDAKIRQVMHRLLIPIKSVLLNQQIEKRSMLNQLLLSQVLREKGLWDLAIKELEVAKNLNENQEERTAGYRYFSFLILRELQENLAQQDHRSEMEFQNSYSYLVHAFISGILRTACYIHNHQNLFKKSYELPFLDAILKEVGQNEELKGYAPIGIYFYIYRALTDENDINAFLQFKRLLASASKTFSSSELKEIYQNAINYCTQKINHGHNEMIPVIMDFYETGLDLKIFREGNTIPNNIYRDIVQYGLKNNKAEWVKAFMDHHKPILHPAYREVTFYNAPQILDSKNGKR